MDSSREIAELNARINLLVAMASATKAELAQKNEALARQEEALARKNKELARKSEELARKSDELARNSEEIESLRGRVDAIMASTSWRLTARLRSAAELLRKRT